MRVVMTVEITVDVDVEDENDLCVSIGDEGQFSITTLNDEYPDYTIEDYETVGVKRADDDD